MDPTLCDRMALRLPTPWVGGPDREWASNTHHLLGIAVDSYNEAVLACELFNVSYQQSLGALLAGGRPSMERNAVWLYAKAFVYALSTTRALVRQVGSQQGAPRDTRKACKEFVRAFEHVKQIRDSLQHIEERAVGRAGSRLLTAVLLSLGTLCETRFGVTTDDSQLVEIDVSEATLDVVRLNLWRVVRSLPWNGLAGVPIDPGTI